jgi:glycosyltransferase involved in cell wall biosynthesis
MKKMTISYFGCIDLRYSRNATNISGLTQAGAEVNEVVVNTPVTPLNAARHLGLTALLKRLAHKLNNIPKIMNNWKTLQRSDVIFVGYPGQFDVPFAYVVAKILRKPLVFDPVILMFNALSNDIGVMSKESPITRLLKFFEKIVMNLPDLVIASTVEQKAFFIDQVGIPANKIVVAYLAADDKIYFPASSVKKDKNFKAVYYGLFTPLHGIPHIIEAARLCQKDSNIVFQMIGKGQLYKEAVQRVNELKLKNVQFFPDTMEKDALHLLQQADVFFGFMETNPTALREIPNKVYQGMALAKTVITSDSPAIRSVFENRKHIYLVPPGNGLAIARAIQYLKGHPATQKAISQHAYDLFQERFTPLAVGKVMLSAISRLNSRSE